MAAREIGDVERVEAPRPLDVDRVLLDDPAGPAGEEDHAVAEAHRLAHVVGHEHHAQARLTPQPLELVVEHVAGHGVERAERLVHQQHVGFLCQRARHRDPLAHAAGELVGELAAERLEAHEVQELVGLLVALGARHLADLEGQLDVAPRGQPREQRRFLEHQRGVVGPGADRARARADRGPRRCSAACSCRSPTRRAGTRTHPSPRRG